MTRQPILWEAIRKCLSRGGWTSLQEIYDYVQRSINLDDEDYEPQSPSSDLPKWKRNVRNVLQHRKKVGDIEWDGHAHYKL